MQGQASSAVLDAVVLGAGPAGCAAAVSLKQAGVSRVLLVESTRHRDLHVGESVPPDIRTPLDELGLWDEFLAENHEACLGSCSSWGADALGYNDFLFNPLGSGWHLDRGRFDRFLARKAAERGAEICRGMRFDACEPLGRGGFRLRLVGDDGRTRTVAARFVVDATGILSRFARCMGARRHLHDQLLCVSAFFELPDPARFSRLTMLEAVEYGWWYAAKLPNARSAVVVASDAQIIKNIGLQRGDRWFQRLVATNHISGLLSGCRLIANTQLTCAAPSFVLDKVGGDGWLAVGDAASTFDPISSQGIHKALSDGSRAGKAIASHLHGNDSQLTEYASSIASRFQRYCYARHYFYGLEKRWPDSSFWKRRCLRNAEPDDRGLREAGMPER
jgi:flavin-dependent dehydrogenase